MDLFLFLGHWYRGRFGTRGRGAVSSPKKDDEQRRLLSSGSCVASCYSVIRCPGTLSVFITFH